MAENKVYRGDEPTERSGEFSEKSRSIDSFIASPPQVSEPASPVASAQSGVDPHDFDD